MFESNRMLGMNIFILIALNIKRSIAWYGKCISEVEINKIMFTENKHN